MHVDQFPVAHSLAAALVATLDQAAAVQQALEEVNQQVLQAEQALKVQVVVDQATLVLELVVAMLEQMVDRED